MDNIIIIFMKPGIEILSFNTSTYTYISNESNLMLYVYPLSKCYVLS